ncbi:SCO3242 family prenyltransferase [Intrasporangium sp. YIM S08009]|uniref:SCO3242 family prenyltransferase n=1 Tax=Intrasporangium zincisolvens TaxID=3080018 RepID=UPI002B060701|nr:UbiA family prenyltransferase [Intrasporangium sp. YIM S08009]
MTTLRDLAELVRAPAALTVPGDTLSGAAAAGWPGGRRTLLLPVASTCLYWAGMALNDWADRDLDATERPERPIPSGRVPARTALGVAAGLTVGGVAVAGVAAGRAGAAVATLLAAAVWAYDLGPKDGPLGAATMASTRALDVALGASAGGLAGIRTAAVPAALVGAHTAGVTALSRGEVHGGSVSTARAVAIGTAAVAAASALVGGRAGLAGLVGPVGPGNARRGSRVRRAGSLALSTGMAAWYARGVLRAQLDAVRSPDAATVRRATGHGIRGFVPLQGSLVAGRGRPEVALALAASVPVGRLAMRVVSPT